MARNLCTQCHYPSSHCVCKYVIAVENTITVWILRHPHELSQAKSTTPLLQLALKRINVCTGENPGDFLAVQSILDQGVAVVYPSEQANAIEQLSEQRGAIKHIILLDGTWSKVHRLWQLNPWLHTLPSLTFAQPPASEYRIRKANRDDSLSTLEAANYCLAQLEGLSTQSLKQLLAGFVQEQLKNMPAHVRQRYSS
ncbi:tRNA-uridine aminocarboxypropyltransferase [Pseudoalteromonas ruthenica]|uniref:tRNA-uridine aminocarboxypropyltransferase n=1 Tax=Pseudoalteromonas ruthenica TaxID=151081 RepID=UPI00241DE97A|nr:tRNA-uridine aminocarboxypropyltransferase [Pseudoalteromonas ruthenica]